ncbi:MAG: hypothetical protein AAF489_05080 [Bacteroidota bacterium]
MIKKLLSVFTIAVVLVSCQFTETMVLNEDGSGTLSVTVDMKEMMAFGDLANDSTMVKMDTVVRIKDVLLKKKDSIAKLSKDQQDRLKKIEDFNFRTFMDPDKGEMFFDIFTNFKKVEEASELMSAFESGGDFLQSTGSDTSIHSDPDSGGAMAVSYEYKKNKFVRNAYITDKAKHQMQMDSMKQAEGFMGSMIYKLKYTFPKRIVKSSIEDARFTMDGKTIEVESTFLEYLKNPDVLDLEVELEN